MIEHKCDCMECRIRHAIFGGSPDAPFAVNLNDVYNAMGNVMGELLAHAPTKTAKRFIQELLEARKRWQEHPRVRAQHPEGRA